MQKIFIVTPWFLPAFRAGGPVQSVANMIAEFGSEENVVYSIFCADTDLNAVPLEGIEKNKWVKYNDYCQVWYAGSTGRKKILLEKIVEENPDVLYIIGIYDPVFNLYPMLQSKVPNIILSVRGMLHPGALSQKTIKKKLYLGFMKMAGINGKVTYHATDEEEAAHIVKAMGSGAKVAVAGNFPRRIQEKAPLEKKEGGLTMLSIALISPMKNILMVLESLKQVRGTVIYHIYGPVKDTQYWDACEKCIRELPGNVSVVHHGEIAPWQIEGYLQNSHLFVLPSKSENFGHAIFESLIAGRPVITSMNTPWKNLSVAGAGFNAALSETALASAIQTYIDMPMLEYENACRAAASYANARLNLHALKQQYRDLFRSNQKTPHEFIV